MKKRLSFLLALWMVIFSIGGTYVAADETAADNGEDISLIVEGKEDKEQTDADGAEDTAADEEAKEIEKDDLPTYDKYIEQHASAKPATKEIVIAGGDFAKDKGAKVEAVDFDGKKNVLKWESQEGSVSWKVKVPESGLYALGLDYQAIQRTNKAIELSLKIDGNFPFREADEFSFSRIFTDERDEDGNFKQDDNGNELTPNYIEMFAWRTANFMDYEGMHTEPFVFYLEKGTHTIELGAIREPLYIASILLEVPGELPQYKDIAPQDGEENNTTDVFKQVQAENASGKADPVSRPTADYSSPATEPYGGVRARMNAMGGEMWKYTGQWVSWDLDVPEDGWYKIGIKYKQSYVRGLFTTYSVKIDGDFPCEELKSVRFTYASGWQINEVGSNDNKPYYFYLTKGTHTITMEPSLDELSGVMAQVQESQTSLNALYRKIIMITGVVPDSYQDYDLERDIPNLLNTMTSEANLLYSQAAALEAVIGKEGSSATVLYTMADQLLEFVDHPSRIAKKLTAFKENLSALSQWILTLKEQPLQLDYLYLASADQEAPKADANFFESLWHQLVQLYGSYTMDYETIGDANSDSIVVWTSTARDQANIVKRLSDESFTSKTGISVNVQLVTTSLINAIMANYAPDVYLSATRDTPVNLALRGALQALDNYEGYEEVTSWFVETGMDPYKIEGKTFALPETQTFDMMFYRQDVLDDLGLELPQTWDELLEIAPILQHNNMEIGLPGATVFQMLLLQSGGSYYNDELTECTFTSEYGIDAFKKWVSFYSDYGFNLYKDDYNRFRSGEMPITICEYPMYNKLKVAAPEISGLWGVAMVPGIENENGEIVRTQIGAGAACVMPKASTERGNDEKAWEYMKWWVSADTQADYGNDIEALLGAAARYSTANIEGFGQLPWSKSEADAMNAQREHVIELPQLPGGYYVARNLDNAFKATYLRNEDAREMLTYWTLETNREITRKREEFGLHNGTWKG